MKIKQLSLLLFPFAAWCLLHCLGSLQPTPGAAQPLQKRRSNMTNLQIVKSGPSVALGAFSSTALTAGGAALALYQGATLVSTSATFNNTTPTTATIAGLTVTFSGGSAGSTSGSYPTSVAATGTAAVGTGYTLVSNGLANYEQSVAFDVVPAPDTTAPTFGVPAIPAAGTTLVLPMTETGSPPVLAASGFGVSQGCTLSGCSGGAVSVNAVNISGTTATLLLSRTIGTTETGGLLSIAAGAFSDSATPANATAAATNLAVTNNSTQTPPVSKPQHLFSSGTLVANWLDSQSNPVSAPFAALQDIGTDLSFDRRDLWDAASVSLFPIDSADSMGKLTFKLGNATISADTLQRIVAGQLATAGGVTTLTLPRSVKLPVFSAVLTLTDTKGKAITVNLNLVKAKGVTLPFKINDFVIEQFELDCYPDAVSGIIGTWMFGS